MDLTQYRDEVHPDHVVMLDGYCLRLLEYGDMTPKEMSLWVGFLQAIYRQNKAGKGTIRNIPHYEVMRFAMMSRAAFFRELQDAKVMGGRKFVAGGHVEILPEDAHSDSYANRYRVLTSPLLTRHDCALIESILLADIAMVATHDEAKQAVLQTLDNLAEHDPADWINQDVDSPGRPASAHSGYCSPHSSILMEIFQKTWLSPAKRYTTGSHVRSAKYSSHIIFCAWLCLR